MTVLKRPTRSSTATTGSTARLLRLPATAAGGGGGKQQGEDGDTQRRHGRQRITRCARSIHGGAAFDVWSDGMGGNVGWLVSGGTGHTVDLVTGKATVVGAIGGLTGAVTDIAILPAM